MNLIMLFCFFRLHFRKSFAQSSLLAGLFHCTNDYFWPTSFVSLTLLPSIFYLSGPGGVIVACLLAISAYTFLPFNWSWNYYFLFGAVLSSTDPVSLVHLLKHSKASSSLSTIISGGEFLLLLPLCVYTNILLCVCIVRAAGRFTIFFLSVQLASCHACLWQLRV